MQTPAVYPDYQFKDCGVGIVFQVSFVEELPVTDTSKSLSVFDGRMATQSK